MRGVVYYGDQFVEVPDGSVTLGDICAAFGITGDLTGVCIKNRISGLVVATLPFESLPAESLDDDGDTEALAYDLSTPADGRDEAGENAPNTEDMATILKQLVDLGAAPLLGMESDSSAMLDPYEPHASPGLLVRTIYPSSVYSPYRYNGDPAKSLERYGAVPTTVLQAVGPPYFGTVERYTLEEATETALQKRPDLTPKTEEEANDLMQGLVTVAAQAKAMIAIANLEEGRRAPVDVKPSI
ncbi:hypothetical protein ERJ75_001415800 [Trypanosoma vivax]|uniref:Uncharacterized protein n=1 Tax=Trypanosoma vivax (strain Y486) TaxID=1055687 RepID=G0TUF2_TRYVY|nr:hypothetical protein TRVL_01605 [Trypanosoma vivax]KAH8607420.1 hypothetical protein ERJ75_001415800 [Trypanosoma vivax]CCC47586.1 conserved hypothetical protein [Trypanosoma vivax Y486]